VYGYNASSRLYSQQTLALIKSIDIPGLIDSVHDYQIQGCVAYIDGGCVVYIGAASSPSSTQ
jgi:hypothetical protein